LRPTTLIRVGSSYFIDEDEMEQLMNLYFQKQIQIRQKRADQARKMFSKVNQKKNSPGRKDPGSNNNIDKK
jgi:hypothetical protein